MLFSTTFLLAIQRLFQCIPGIYIYYENQMHAPLPWPEHIAMQFNSIKEREEKVLAKKTFAEAGKIAKYSAVGAPRVRAFRIDGGYAA